MSETDLSRLVHEAFETVDTREKSVDDRIADALKRMEQTEGELDRLLKPTEVREAHHGGLGELAAVCRHVEKAIGEFLQELFGQSHPALSERDHHAREIAQRLDLEIGELKELQEVRHDLEETSRKLHGLQDSPALRPLFVPPSEVDSIRGELVSVHQLLQELIDRMRGTAPQQAPQIEIKELPPLERVEIVGHPDEDARFWHKQGDNDLGCKGTCAVTCQQMIADHFAGDPSAFTENQFLHEATANLWFVLPDSGTPPDAVGRLLELHGLHTERTPSGSLQDLADRLSRGQEAIVGVSSAVLWNDPTTLGDHHADHVLWVSGAKVVEHGSQREVVSVFINDSGDSHGREREVPIAQFMEAWNASGRDAVYALPGVPTAASMGGRL